MDNNEPQYKELKFKGKADFDEWLNRTAKKIIDLKDEGQDFLRFWIDERGEILHTAPFGASNWNGKMIDVKSVKKNRCLKFLDGYVLKHPVKSVS